MFSASAYTRDRLLRLFLNQRGSSNESESNGLDHKSALHLSKQQLPDQFTVIGGALLEKVPPE